MIPYIDGDDVVVEFTPLFGEPKWIHGIILACDAPKGIRDGRYQCRVSIGISAYVPFEARIYCDATGVGEGIRPLTASEEISSV